MLVEDKAYYYFTCEMSGYAVYCVPIDNKYGCMNRNDALYLHTKQISKRYDVPFDIAYMDILNAYFNDKATNAPIKGMLS
jgi:hypothetical protein